MDYNSRISYPKSLASMLPVSKQHPSKIDVFSIVTGIIGLLADIISLYGIFNSFETSKKSDLSIWIIGWFAIVYSVMFINFIIRRLFENRLFQKKKDYLKYRREVDFCFFGNKYEMSIHISTLWSSLPILSIYTCALITKFNLYSILFINFITSLILSYWICIVIQHSIRFVCNFLQEEQDDSDSRFDDWNS